MLTCNLQPAKEETDQPDNSQTVNNEEVKALQYSQILRQTCEERNPRQTKISQKMTISVNFERHLVNRKSSTSQKLSSSKVQQMPL